MFDLDDLFPDPPAKLPSWQRDLLCVPGSLPVDTIRQSWLSNLRRCSMKAYLDATESGVGGTTFNMFGGSVFHKAFEHAAANEDINSWVSWTADTRYWHDVFAEVQAEHPDNTYDFDVDQFAWQLASDKPLDGIRCGQLIYFGILMLRSGGFEIRECELRMKLEIPGGIPFTGTLDILLWHSDVGLVIADTKTSGIWQRYSRGKAVTKQSYSTEQISNHLQLIHYDWKGRRLGLWNNGDVGRYMIFCPANLTRYTRGAKKDQFKGDPYFWGEPHRRSVDRYEEDLKSWLDFAKAGNFIRMYPSMFGKLDCPSCPHAQGCLNDKSSMEVPDYLKNLT